LKTPFFYFDLKSFGLGLFSRSVARQLSSALRRFTSEFEMGSGGSAQLLKTERLKTKICQTAKRKRKKGKPF